MLTSLVSGIFAGLAASNAKLLSNIFKYFPPGEYFSLGATYLHAGLILVGIGANFLNLNITIGLYSQLAAMPPYESSVIIGNLLCGGIVMNEFEHYEAYQLGLIFAGSFICINGILYREFFYPKCFPEPTQEGEDEQDEQAAPGVAAEYT